MRRRLFIQRLLAQRDIWEALINQAGFSHLLTMPGVCGQWSIKDILAHVLGYEQFIADRIHEIEHGEAYTPSQTSQAYNEFLLKFGYPDFDSPLLDDDSANAWLVEKYKNVPLEEVVAQEMNAINAIIAGLRQHSEINDQTALSTIQKAPITLFVTKMSGDDVALMKGRKAVSLQAAVDLAVVQQAQQRV